MNEGHSAFLALERIRMLMQEQRTSVRRSAGGDAGRTTSSRRIRSVPAGIDLFDAGMMYEYFHEYCDAAGISFEQLMALGRRHPHDINERFSMAILAFKTSSYRNAVSRLHREVSQEMWQDLWPKLPVWEVPITSGHQRRPPAHLAQRRSGDALRSVSAAGLARTAIRIRRPGSRFRIFRIRSCGKRIAAASAA